MVMDVHGRYRIESHSEATGRFNERFLLSFASCKACVVMDDELNILPISSHIKSITLVPVNEAVRIWTGAEEFKRKWGFFRWSFDKVSVVHSIKEKLSFHFLMQFWTRICAAQFPRCHDTSCTPMLPAIPCWPHHVPMLSINYPRKWDSRWSGGKPVAWRKEKDRLARNEKKQTAKSRERCIFKEQGKVLESGSRKGEWSESFLLGADQFSFFWIKKKKGMR